MLATVSAREKEQSALLFNVKTTSDELRVVSNGLCSSSISALIAQSRTTRRVFLMSGLKKRIIYLVLIVMVVGLMVIVYHKTINRVEQGDAFLFGTYVRIMAYGPGARGAIEQTLNEMARIQELTASDRGPVAKINSLSGRQAVEVDEEFFTLLKCVSSLAEKTGGYFNPVIGPLVEIWGFGYGGTGQIPSPKEIAMVLPLTERADLILNAKERTVFLRKEGMRLDLGGVAKGYAVDRGWEILRSSGIKGALINGGESSIRVLGTRPGGAPWRIAISHPREEKWVGVLELPPGKAIGTSADTQRFFESGGRRYSHLLNPFSGYPPTDLLAATLVADTALEADLFSTAVFVAEGEDRSKLILRLQAEGVMVNPDGKVTETPGLRDQLREAP